MAILIPRKWEMPGKFYFSGNLINQTENRLKCVILTKLWENVVKTKALASYVYHVSYSKW